MIDLKNIRTIDAKSLNPNLEIKVIKSDLPEKLAHFGYVLINVPTPFDGQTGDKHMKFVPAHYLRVDCHEKYALIINVPEHYVRGDFSLPAEKRCAVTRHFYVRPESLGTRIVASVEVLKNSNGSIALNIVEIVSVDKRSPQNNEVVLSHKPIPGFKISMRPVKEGETESKVLFLIPGTDRCLEFIPLPKPEIVFMPVSPLKS